MVLWERSPNIIYIPQNQSLAFSYLEIVHSFWTFLFDFHGILESTQEVRSVLWKLLKIIFETWTPQKCHLCKKTQQNFNSMELFTIFHSEFSFTFPNFLYQDFFTQKNMSDMSLCFCSWQPNFRHPPRESQQKIPPTSRFTLQGRSLGSIGFCLTVGL